MLTDVSEEPQRVDVNDPHSVRVAGTLLIKANPGLVLYLIWSPDNHFHFLQLFVSQ